MFLFIKSVYSNQNTMQRKSDSVTFQTDPGSNSAQMIRFQIRLKLYSEVPFVFLYQFV